MRLRSRQRVTTLAIPHMLILLSYRKQIARQRRTQIVEGI